VVTYEILKSLFYEENGEFFSLKTNKRVGCYRKDGYYLVRIRKLYLGHRLLWMWYNKCEYDDLPKVIDHIDGNPSNNQFENLRCCTSNLNNLYNTKPQKGTSEYKGVCYKQKSKKWTAQITVDRISIHLGCFDDEKNAALKYNEAARYYFGEFARINEVKE
jgi:hypothetical protein